MKAIINIPKRHLRIKAIRPITHNFACGKRAGYFIDEPSKEQVISYLLNEEAQENICQNCLKKIASYYSIKYRIIKTAERDYFTRKFKTLLKLDENVTH